MVVVVLVGLVVVVGLLLYTNLFKNPYKEIVYLGKAGAGKSTVLTKQAYKHYKRGWKVYSTDNTIPYTVPLDLKDLKSGRLPEDSLVIIDEIGILWDNRKFKNFESEKVEFFKKHRHDKVKIIAASQNLDYDKKIRDMTDNLWLLKNHLNIFTFGRRVGRKLVCVQSNAQAPSTIREDLYLTSPLLFISNLEFTFIPKWARRFNSFEKPQIEQLEYDKEKIIKPKSNNFRNVIDFYRNLIKDKYGKRKCGNYISKNICR